MRFLRKTTSIQNSFVQRTTVKQGEVAEVATREGIQRCVHVWVLTGSLAVLQV